MVQRLQIGELFYYIGRDLNANSRRQSKGFHCGKLGHFKIKFWSPGTQTHDARKLFMGLVSDPSKPEANSSTIMLYGLAQENSALT